MESNSGYPGSYAMKGERIARTAALSTCVLYYNGYRVAAFAGRALGRDVAALEAKAAKLKEAINARLWMADAGYYAYYRDVTLDIAVKGHGTRLAAFRLDGKAQPQPFLDGALKGVHAVAIEMDE